MGVFRQVSRVGRHRAADAASPWSLLRVAVRRRRCRCGGRRRVRVRDSGDIARRSGGAMTTRGEWARSRRCCSGIARSAL